MKEKKPGASTWVPFKKKKHLSKEDKSRKNFKWSFKSPMAQTIQLRKERLSSRSIAMMTFSYRTSHSCSRTKRVP